jgi:prevent-host-death family protein
VPRVLQRATLNRMETVTHREMRNRSGEILRRVEAGESMLVSNNGRLAALIVPVGGDPLDGLIARGEARPARTGSDALADITRAVSPVSTRELIDCSRGRW